MTALDNWITQLIGGRVSQNVEPVFGDFDDVIAALQQMASGGYAAGSDTQVQYNDNGLMGADQNFCWDDVQACLGWGNALQPFPVPDTTKRTTSIYSTFSGSQADVPTFYGMDGAWTLENTDAPGGTRSFIYGYNFVAITLGTGDMSSNFGGYIAIDGQGSNDIQQQFGWAAQMLDEGSGHIAQGGAVSLRTPNFDGTTVIDVYTALLIDDAANIGGGTNATVVQQFRSDADGGTKPLTQMQSGEVGIWTATPTAGFALDVAGKIQFSDSALPGSLTTFTDHAAAQAGTLTNSPTAGNPAKWIGINDNGTALAIPAWAA